MKTIFDPATKEELFARIDNLTPSNERQWGKMSPAQAMEHMSRGVEMGIGDSMKQVFLGKLLSWMFRKEFLGEKPFRQNAPTGPDFVVKDEPDFESTRSRLKSVIDQFHSLGEAGTDGKAHPFFGTLTGKQWGETQYKHVDHHLRQFGG